METEDWNSDGLRITDEKILERLEQTLENVGPLVIEHRFYRGSRQPHWFVVTNAGDLRSHLATQTRPGDSFHVWSFAEVCTDANVLQRGKVPDAQGRTPRGGAY